MVRQMISSCRRLGCNPSILLLVLSLTACSPKYDWRDVHGEEASYTVLMPAKPNRLSRDIQLGQKTVTMHMTASEVDEVKFVVGAIKMPDATEAQTAIPLIKNTLLKNMAGTINQEKTIAATVGGKLAISDEFNAFNPTSSVRMSGRIVARDVWVFEVLVVGPERAINQESVDTFFDSFKPN